MGREWFSLLAASASSILSSQVPDKPLAVKMGPLPPLCWILLNDQGRDLSQGAHPSNASYTTRILSLSPKPCYSLSPHSDAHLFVSYLESLSELN